MVRYGIVGDIEKNPEGLVHAVNTLRDKYHVDVLIGNGDLCDVMEDERDTYNNGALIWTAFIQSGLESYVIPGNHDNFSGFGRLNKNFALHNAVRPTAFEYGVYKISKGNHDLVFIPGSVFVVPHGYVFGIERESGIYLRKRDTFEPISQEDLEWLQKTWEHGGSSPQDFIFYTDLREISKVIDGKRPTIVFSHVPRKFEGLSDSVDSGHGIEVYRVNLGEKKHEDPELMKYFIEKVDYHIFDENLLRRLKLLGYLVMEDTGFVQSPEPNASRIILPSQFRKEVPIIGQNEASKTPFSSSEQGLQSIIDFAEYHSEGRNIVYVAVERKGGRGSEELKNEFEKAGVRIVVNGHFHHFCSHDEKGRSVMPGVVSDTLFINHGSFDDKSAVILEVHDDGEVSYERPII